MASVEMCQVGVLPTAKHSGLGFTQPSRRQSTCRSVGALLSSPLGPRSQRTAILGMNREGIKRRETSASSLSLSFKSSVLGRPLSSLKSGPLWRKSKQKPCIAAAQANIVQPAIAVAGSVLGRIPSVILIPSCVAAIVYALTGLEGLVRLIRNRFKKLLNHPEEVPGEDNWSSSRVRKYVLPYIKPVVIWAAIFVLCGALDRLPTPLILSSVKAKTVNVVRVFAAVFSVTYCITVLIQQTQAVVYQPVGPTEQVGKELVVQTVEAGIWFLGFALGMELLGVASNSFITAGGIGTLVFTFAGKEIVGNALSGMTIQATKPFTVGDWISIMVNGQFVEGHVEAMGWWQLTLKTFERESSRIANQQVINSVITNVTAKTHWRFKSYIHLYLFTPEEQVQKIVMDIRKLLAEHPKIEHRTLHRRVFYDGHNISVPSKDVLVSCYFQTRWQEEYSKLKEELMYEIERIISLHGSRYATPIRTHDYTAGRTPPTMSHSPYDSPTQRLFLAEMTVYKNPTDSSKVAVVDVIPSTPTTVDVTDTAVVNPVGGQGDALVGRAESDDVAVSEARADVSGKGAENGADVSGKGAERGNDVSGKGTENGADVSGKGAENGADVSGKGAENGAAVSGKGAERGNGVSGKSAENGADVSGKGAENGADVSGQNSKRGVVVSGQGAENGADVSKRGKPVKAELSAKETVGKEAKEGDVGGTEPTGKGYGNEVGIRNGNDSVGVTDSGTTRGDVSGERASSDSNGASGGLREDTQANEQAFGRRAPSDNGRGGPSDGLRDDPQANEQAFSRRAPSNTRRGGPSDGPREDTLERELAEVLRRASSPARSRGVSDGVPFSDGRRHLGRSENRSENPNSPERGLRKVSPVFTLQYKTPQEAAAAASAFSAAAAEAAAAAQALLNSSQPRRGHFPGQIHPPPTSTSGSVPSGGHSAGQVDLPAASTSNSSSNAGHSTGQIDSTADFPPYPSSKGGHSAGHSEPPTASSSNSSSNGGHPSGQAEAPAASTSYSSSSGGHSRRPSVAPLEVESGRRNGPVQPLGPRTSDRSEASDSPRGVFESLREHESMSDVPYRGIKEGSSPGREWAKQYFAGDRPSARGFASVSEFEHLYDSDNEEDLRTSEGDVADDLAPMSEEESAAWRQADSTAAAASKNNERLHEGGRFDTKGPVGGKSDGSSAQQRHKTDGTGPLEGLETMGLSRSDITLLGIAIDKTGRQSAVLDSAFDPSVSPTQLAQRSSGTAKTQSGSLGEGGNGKEGVGREDVGTEKNEKEHAGALVGKDGVLPTSGNNNPPVPEQMG